MDEANCITVNGAASGTRLIELGDGLHNLSAHAISAGGAKSAPVSWAVLSDGSPPVFGGSVRIGDGTGFWGVDNEVVCRFEPAFDAESWVVGYTVSLVEVRGSCGGPFPMVTAVPALPSR